MPGFGSVTVAFPAGTTQQDIEAFVATLSVSEGVEVSVNFTELQSYVPPEGGGTPEPVPETPPA